MPGYPVAGMKTWLVGDAWPVTDANIYVRDAFNSVRTFQNSEQMFSDTAVTGIGTTATTVANHAGALLTATPSETYQMLVVATVVFFTAAGGAVSGVVQIFDQNTADITLPAGGNTFVLTAAASGGVTAVAFGKGQYATGVNAGFTVKAKTNTGTTSAICVSHVMFRPTT